MIFFRKKLRGAEIFLNVKRENLHTHSTCILFSELNTYKFQNLDVVKTNVIYLKHVHVKLKCV